MADKGRLEFGIFSSFLSFPSPRSAGLTPPKKFLWHVDQTRQGDATGSLASMEFFLGNKNISHQFIEIIVNHCSSEATSPIFEERELTQIKDMSSDWHSFRSQCHFRACQLNMLQLASKWVV